MTSNDDEDRMTSNRCAKQTVKVYMVMKVKVDADKVYEGGVYTRYSHSHSIDIMRHYTTLHNDIQHRHIHYITYDTLHMTQDRRHTDTRTQTYRQRQRDRETETPTVEKFFRNLRRCSRLEAYSSES